MFLSFSGSVDEFCKYVVCSLKYLLFSASTNVIALLSQGTTVHLWGSRMLQDPVWRGSTAVEVFLVQHLWMVFWGTHARRELTVLWALPFHSHVLLVIIATQLGILGLRTVSYVMQVQY